MKRLGKIIAILLLIALLLGAIGGIAACIVLEPYADSSLDDALLHVARSGGTSRLYAYTFSNRAAREGEAHEIGPLCGGNT